MVIVTYHSIVSNAQIVLQEQQLHIKWGSDAAIVYDYVKNSLAKRAWEDIIYAISSSKGPAVIDMRLFELFNHTRYELRWENEQPALYERKAEASEAKLILKPGYLPDEKGKMAQERFLKALKEKELLK